MQVLVLLMVYCLANISVCFVGTIISAEPNSIECLYFGSKLSNTTPVFVCCVFVGVVHLAILGLTMNLYCYHLWLRKHNLTTLEHILKFKGSKNLNQIKPLPSTVSEQTQRNQERVVIRQELKLKSKSNSVSSKDEDLLISSEQRLRSGNGSTVTEGFSLGRPKTKHEKAEEYFRKPEKRISSKLVSESSNSLSGKESSERNIIDQNTADKNGTTESNNQETPKLLAKPLASKENELDSNHKSAQTTLAKKVQKKKLTPIFLDPTENSKTSRSKDNN